ncbi:MAG TPA: hypothetical protein VFK05_23590 [Polyangiaceae bacterium]|nr:hypothetical protein [Polyangiaceae bacterium]
MSTAAPTDIRTLVTLEFEQVPYRAGKHCRAISWGYQSAIYWPSYWGKPAGDSRHEHEIIAGVQPPAQARRSSRYAVRCIDPVQFNFVA